MSRTSSIAAVSPQSTMKAVLELPVQGLVPVFGYSLEVTRAATPFRSTMAGGFRERVAWGLSEVIARVVWRNEAPSGR